MFNEKLFKINLNKFKGVLEPIDIINTFVLPSLNDDWIAGITNGERSFTISIILNSPAFRIRYILTQKWESNKYVLEHIMKLFNRKEKKTLILVMLFHILLWMFGSIGLMV
jgi:hypothetical protein